MNALCFELAFDPACNPPIAPQLEPSTPEPKPPEVEPHDLELRLLDQVRLSEPITLARLQHALGVSADMLLRKLGPLVAAGTITTWTDDTLTGDGRQFIGTGQPDPQWIEGDRVDLHPQTALATIRSARMISVKQLAKRLGCDERRLMALLREFGRAGLLSFRPRGSGFIVEATR